MITVGSAAFVEVWSQSLTGHYSWTTSKLSDMLETEEFRIESHSRRMLSERVDVLILASYLDCFIDACTY